jgi:hypothetical protein
LLDSVPFIGGTRLQGRTLAVAAIALLLLPVTPLLQARSRRALGKPSGIEPWQRVNVAILARGSHVSSSTGNMDSYLVLLSERKNSEPVTARLVHYYPGFEYRISDEAITSHRQFRVAVTAATYRAMDAKGFVIERAFDPEAIYKIHGSLPCFVIRK